MSEKTKAATTGDEPVGRLETRSTTTENHCSPKVPRRGNPPRKSEALHDTRESLDGPHGLPGPGDAPVVSDEDPDLEERAQAVSFALARLAVLTWTMLRFPTEMSGPVRLLLRALEHGCVPRCEWFEAMEKFLPPAPPDWGAA